MQQSSELRSAELGDLGSGGLGDKLANGGAWVLVRDLATQVEHSPRWGCCHRLLLPSGVAFTLATLVAAYFGIPSILLSMMALALFVGHFWPRWRAREVAEYWTPLERYLQFTIYREGLVTCSAGGGRQVTFQQVRRMHRSEVGWLLWFRDHPMLWIPRRAFGQDQVRLIEGVLGGLPAERPLLSLGWMYVGAGALSIAGTWAWSALV